MEYWLAILADSIWEILLAIFMDMCNFSYFPIVWQARDLKGLFVYLR